MFASGGFPVANEPATILHAIFSWLDYLYPKPSPLVLMLVIGLGIALIVYGRRRSARKQAAYK